jgi:hypothetical protein
VTAAALVLAKGDAPGWTGVVAAIVAAAVFVLFSGWIVWQRVRDARRGRR